MPREKRSHLFSVHQIFRTCTSPCTFCTQTLVVKERTISIKRFRIVLVDETNRRHCAHVHNLPIGKLLIIILGHECKITAKRREARFGQIEILAPSKAYHAFVHLQDGVKGYDKFAGSSLNDIFRRNVHKAVISILIFREKHERRVNAPFPYPHRKTDYRLDGRKMAVVWPPFSQACIVEFLYTVHICIDECQCRERQLARLADKPGNLADGIAHRIGRADI